eukprot:735412-Amphidinium_carterae.1
MPTKIKRTVVKRGSIFCTSFNCREGLSEQTRTKQIPNKWRQVRTTSTQKHEPSVGPRKQVFPSIAALVKHGNRLKMLSYCVNVDSAHLGASVATLPRQQTLRYPLEGYLENEPCFTNQ